MVKVKGPDRIPTDNDPETGTSKERSSQTYTWIEFHGHNDIFTAWPEHKDLLLMYDDDFFKNNTWMWGGNPHWAYAKSDFMVKIEDRDAIEWTPNTISSKIMINRTRALIELVSDTPNLKEYQIKISPSEEWVKVDNPTEINLKESRYNLTFRTINLVGVFGPEHRVVIDSE